MHWNALKEAMLTVKWGLLPSKAAETQLQRLLLNDGLALTVPCKTVCQL